jgi:hypothetical protein
MRARPSASSAAKFISTPMRRIRLGLLRACRERPSRRAAEQAPRRHVIDCIAAHANPTEMSIFLRRDPVT